MMKKALVTLFLIVPWQLFLFLGVITQKKEESDIDNDLLVVLLCAPACPNKEGGRGNVDNDEDCDGCDHLAVSYRRQHRLLPSYLEMVQAGADLYHSIVYGWCSTVWTHAAALYGADPWCQFELQH